MSQVYAIGVDWADDKHDVCVLDEQGHRVLERSFDETPEGFSELGRLLDEWAEQGIELVACIEKPEGLVIELLIDHSVRVYPINPKSLKTLGMCIARADPETMCSMRSSWPIISARITKRYERSNPIHRRWLN